jgi:hypothetical protein
MGTKEISITSIYRHEETPEEAKLGFTTLDLEGVSDSEWVDILDRSGNVVYRGARVASVDLGGSTLVISARSGPVTDLPLATGFKLVLHSEVPDDAPEPEPAIPLYQSHKRVGALKIRSARVLPNQTQLTFEDERYRPRTMPGDWGRKHRPQPGGYLVYYPDGYVSYSPEKPFEEGHTLIEGA